MIHFNYNGEQYTIVTWYNSIGLMEIKKASGNISRFIRYTKKLTVKDFLSKLEKINFM